MGAEEKNVLGLFAAKVNELLPRSAPAVVTPDVPAAKPKASCTVEQKVEMVKLGLTAEQILAACPN